MSLLSAESNRLILLRREPRHILGCGEPISHVTPCADTRAAQDSKTIEQLETHFQRQLLARERVDDGFEYRRKPRRLHTQECGGERPESGIAFGCPVPSGQVDPRPEQPTDKRSHAMPLYRRSK
jgi:hypothetical protein